MPGKPGRSGRPPKVDKQLVPQSDQNQQKKRPGRPPKSVEDQLPKKPCTSVEDGRTDDDIDSVVTDEQSVLPSPTVHKLRAKSQCEEFKDRLIGKPIEVIPVAKLPICQTILQ